MAESARKIDVDRGMIRHLVIEGTEITLPQAMAEADARKNLGSLVREVNPGLADRLGQTQHNLRVEGDKLVAYRPEAHFG